MITVGTLLQDHTYGCKPRDVRTSSNTCPFNKGILLYTALTDQVCKTFLIHHTENICNEANKSLACAHTLFDLLCFFLFVFFSS